MKNENSQKDNQLKRVKKPKSNSSIFPMDSGNSVNPLRVNYVDTISKCGEKGSPEGISK
jgi:hypothetical protein